MLGFGAGGCGTAPSAIVERTAYGGVGGVPEDPSIAGSRAEGGRWRQGRVSAGEFSLWLLLRVRARAIARWSASLNYVAWDSANATHINKFTARICLKRPLEHAKWAPTLHIVGYFTTVAVCRA